jgi:hypothetical protein
LNHKITQNRQLRLARRQNVNMTTIGIKNEFKSALYAKTTTHTILKGYQDKTQKRHSCYAMLHCLYKTLPPLYALSRAPVLTWMRRHRRTLPGTCSYVSTTNVDTPCYRRIKAAHDTPLLAHWLHGGFVEQHIMRIALLRTVWLGPDGSAPKRRCSF